MIIYLNFNQFDNKVIFSFQATLKMDCLIEKNSLDRKKKFRAHYM
jgi:hypothetical protein